MFEGHSSFSVPEAGDFPLVSSLPNGADFSNHFPRALVSPLQFYGLLPAPVVSGV